MGRNNGILKAAFCEVKWAQIGFISDKIYYTYINIYISTAEEVVIGKA